MTTAAPTEPVTVFFATNRAKKSNNGQGDGHTAYANGKSADISYGTCEVPLSKDRKPGSKDAALPRNVKEKNWIEEVDGQEILIFIHGYFNTFNNAIQTAARVKKDADWKGIVVAFSWPSFGVGQGYSADEDIRRESVSPFLEVLQALKVMLNLSLSLNRSPCCATTSTLTYKLTLMNVLVTSCRQPKRSTYLLTVWEIVSPWKP